MEHTAFRPCLHLGLLSMVVDSQQQSNAGDVFQHLRRSLDQSAAFWDDHSYFEPHTPFFSYLYNLVGLYISS